MTGSTPPRKRRFFSKGADQGSTEDPQHDTRDPERGWTGDGAASLSAAGRGDLPASLEVTAPVARRRTAVVRQKAREGVRKGGARARAGLAHLADRIIDIAPRVPVRDLATLREQFPGLGPEEIADKLVAGAAKATATVGAASGRRP